MVIKLDEKWSFLRVRQLFEKGIYSFEKTGPNTFNFGTYRGKFKSKELLLYDYSLELEYKSPPVFDIDEEASYSIIDILSTSWDVANFYVKPSATISYRNMAAGKNRRNLVDDLRLFGPYLPENLTHYEFYEKTYLAAIDSLFAKGPLVQIMKTGGVFVLFNKSPIFIFDMQSSEGLSLFLNEYFHLKEENKERITTRKMWVCNTFNQQVTSSSLVAFSRDEIGYITPDENALDALLLEIDMRKTTSGKSAEIEALTALPRYCSYKKKTSDMFESISWINDQLLHTRIALNANDNKYRQDEDIKNYFTMNPGTPVISYCALSGRGNLVMETDQELIGYKNGSLKWRKNLASSLTYKPLRLVTSLIENDHILLQENNRIQVIDRMGRELFALNGQFTGEPVQTSIKNQPVFGLFKANELIFYSTETGKVLKRINFPENPISWKGVEIQGKFGVGIKTSNQVVFIDITSGKKSLFKGKSEDFVSFTPTGAIFRGKKGMELHTLKEVIEIQVPSFWKFGGEIALNGRSGQLFYDKNKVAFTVRGTVQWNTTTELTDIDEVQTGHAIIIARDGLQNKLIILNFNGIVADNEERPGQGALQTTPFGTNGCSVTTLLNSFLIQYNF